jgi:hypothetical protein
MIYKDKNDKTRKKIQATIFKDESEKILFYFGKNVL